MLPQLCVTLKKDEKVANIELLNDIASGHKFALKDIKKR